MNKLHHSTLLLICLSLVLVVAAACYPPATPVPPTTAPPPASSNAITNIVWKWQTLNDVAAGTSMKVDDPNKYTIVFYADGTTTFPSCSPASPGVWRRASYFLASR